MDYTNPYLPVNPTAMEGFLQPAVGPDGKKKEFESNVLLASIENMQYAVTVDVLNTVFSAFGTVQKIAIFEKNGGTQALIQYPDIATATVAKEALEGHCIYDGGYSYSDKSRDYTIPPSLSMQQGAPGVAYASGSVPPVSSWDPVAPAGGPTYMSAPGTYPGQAYAPPFAPGAQPLQPTNVLPGQHPYYGS
ncbi:hypothetical protein CASFOL_032839 [Castilleja foliolosa]|uniref:RRM domain-containing protein n=1 Tax=Castilleja foliolosa TaxID=1961234 RepID=A0ABD3C2M1_9LAMI